MRSYGFSDGGLGFLVRIDFEIAGLGPCCEGNASNILFGISIAEPIRLAELVYCVSSFLIVSFSVVVLVWVFK